MWGTNLGRSWHRVEYYADKVSVSGYPNEQVKRNAFMRLKELKCRFKREAKEISEEELIEILKGEIAI